MVNVLRNGTSFVAILVLCLAIGRAAEQKNAKSPKSFEAVQAEIDALHVEKIAWRQIPWKTCLLEGLRESRKQKKPVMLWIFIDRPIDDERC